MYTYFIYMCIRYIYIYIYTHIYSHTYPRCTCTTFVHPYRDRHDGTPTSPISRFLCIHSLSTHIHYVSTTHTASNHTVTPPHRHFAGSGVPYASSRGAHRLWVRFTHFAGRWDLLTYNTNNPGWSTCQLF